MARPTIPQEVREQRLKSIPGKSFLHWVDGYTNGNSKALMRCDNGHEWAAAADRLINVGTGCPKCVVSAITSPESVRRAELSALGGIRFIRWVGEYKNCRSKAELQCEVCSHIWTPNVSNVLHHKKGCPACSGNIRASQASREAAIQSLAGIEFVRWETGHYLNVRSRAVVKCLQCLYVWSAAFSNLFHHKKGCPCCASRGYDPSKPGALYALRSDCGRHIKIGISNVYSRRLRQLQLATPFAFEPIHVFRSDDGQSISDLETEFHRNFQASGFSGFDGATEWLRFDPNIPALMKILGA